MADNAVITRPGSNLTSMVDTCLADLARVEENIRWAHATGFGRGGYDPDAPRSPGSTPIFTADEELGPAIDSPGQPGGEDHVTAPTFDIGVGDHGCRVAYERVAARLADIDVEAARAVHAATGSRIQRPLVETTAQSDLATVLAAIDTIRWRLATVRAVLVADDDRVKRRHIRPHVKAARRMLDRSVEQLLIPLTRSRREPLPLIPNCTNCGIRPQAQRTRRRKGKLVVEPAEGGRCKTCAVWKRRHDGQERPTYLDEKPVAEAVAAAARRRDRGEGWGDA